MSLPGSWFRLFQIAQSTLALPRRGAFRVLRKAIMEDSIFEMELLFNLSDLDEITSRMSIAELEVGYSNAIARVSFDEAIKILTKLANKSYKAGLYKETLEICEKALNLYAYYTYPEGEIECLLYKAKALRALNRMDEVLYPATLAYNLSLCIEGAEKWPLILDSEIERLHYYESVGDLEKSSEIRPRVIALLEVLKNGKRT